LKNASIFAINSVTVGFNRCWKGSILRAVNEVAKKITQEISAHGPISFARFMELALYCPVYGYYEREQDTPGRAGDYFTSVSVGSLFGELLALQFSEWLEEVLKLQARGPRSGAQGREQIVEAGAHDGRLAGDVLGFLRQERPGLFERMEYWIVEPSERRRAWQERRLGEFGHKVRWVRQLSELTTGVRGVVFSNELFDAMPAHRFGWDARQGRWFEWGVSLQSERFVWARMSNSPMAPPLSGHWEALLGALPDGFTLDIAPAAEAWWRAAASRLDEGRLVTIDYGLTEEEFFAPERRDGTLRAYWRHRQGADVLARPGQQDITAHPNFSAIRAAGEEAGLDTETFTTQEEFLMRIAARLWEERAGLGQWTPGRARQFRTLTHPQLLGRPLRVLVQRRGVRRSGQRGNRSRRFRCEGPGGQG
jgi:SAM-dependent MidA family methyltransferase